MTKIKAELLSPVHIGSGIDLQQNIEFLIEDKILTVLDERKILQIIGEENVDKWVACINRKDDLKDLLKQRKQGLSLSEVAKRQMDVYGEGLQHKMSLKEQLHNAQGLPAIPGSSIKGAIRTAIISHLINKSADKVKSVISDFQNRQKSIEQWNQKDFGKLEQIIVNRLLSGSDRTNPNKDVMRFLQIGDLAFNYNTIASNVKILNLQRNGWNFKANSDQLVEHLGQGSEAEFRLKINDELLRKNHLQTETYFLESVEALFNVINEHSADLLEREIKLWQDEHEFPAVVESYLEILREIQQTVSECKKNEAVIRLGGHTGWSSMTGGWAKYNTSLFDESEWEILQKLLNKGRDVDYFPKTRKIEEEYGDAFGFIKLHVLP